MPVNWLTELAGSQAQQLKAFANVGATEFMAAVMPVGNDAQESVARTKRLLASLVGKL